MKLANKWHCRPRVTHGWFRRTLLGAPNQHSNEVLVVFSVHTITVQWGIVNDLLKHRYPFCKGTRKPGVLICYRPFCVPIWNIFDSLVISWRLNFIKVKLCQFIYFLNRASIKFRHFFGKNALFCSYDVISNYFRPTFADFYAFFEIQQCLFEWRQCEPNCKTPLYAFFVQHLFAFWMFVIYDLPLSYCLCRWIALYTVSSFLFAQYHSCRQCLRCTGQMICTRPWWSRAIARSSRRGGDHMNTPPPYHSSPCCF